VKDKFLIWDDVILLSCKQEYEIGLRRIGIPIPRAKLLVGVSGREEYDMISRWIDSNELLRESRDPRDGVSKFKESIDGREDSVEAVSLYELILLCLPCLFECRSSLSKTMSTIFLSPTRLCKISNHDCISAAVSAKARNVGGGL